MTSYDRNNAIEQNGVKTKYKRYNIIKGPHEGVEKSSVSTEKYQLKLLTGQAAS